tara:strand:- start:85 stop:231 length:147 start_codon:yes stop_codon:yes gene_type:complete
MKFKFLFIILLALLASGCANEVLAVPQAVIGGTVNVISAIGDALIFWD